jgi:acetylornithine aminotransferase
VYDKNDREYLDFYGGHAVISIGHTHPHYVKRIEDQLHKIGFYSNSIINNVQQDFADKLGALSGYNHHHLFLCNSGAEAVENALKLASFYNCKEKIISFKKAFHGRTSGTLQVTDNPKIKSAFNGSITTQYLPLNELEPVEAALENGDVAGIVIEGILGVAGIIEPTLEFLKGLRELCDKHDAILILDEVQSGYGRTGNFFAHQAAGIEADVIAMAKGMGNGFPIGGVLVSEKIKASYGLLGTTFGGNHLACAAGLAVLEVIEQENLIENAKKMGEYIVNSLKGVQGIAKITGRGLMLGLVVNEKGKELRDNLLHKHSVFTGGAADPNILRLLPPLNITQKEADLFLNALKAEIKNLGIA